MAKKLWLMMAAGLLIQPQQSRAETDLNSLAVKALWLAGPVMVWEGGKYVCRHLTAPSAECERAQECAASRPGECRKMAFKFFQDRKIVKELSFGDDTENDARKGGFKMVFKKNNRSMCVYITLSCGVGGGVQEEMEEQLKEQWSDYTHVRTECMV